MVAHPSTQGALSALGWLKEQHINPLNIIDIGCGSGILSLAASQIWPKSAILATDISPKALDDCAANIVSQGLSERIKSVRSESASDTPIMASAPYDLLIANVLAAYHIKNATHYTRALRENAWLVLSGIMAWEAEQVIAAMKAVACSLQAEFRQEQWITLIFTKPS